TAESKYRQLIGMSPQTEDFYFGLYDVAAKLKHWDQAALALEQLFEKNPDYKNQLPYEYGTTLYNLKRYDAAEPALKKALGVVDEESLVDRKIKKLMTKSIIQKELVKGKVFVPVPVKPIIIPKRKEVSQEEVHEASSKYGLTLENAFQSEAILVCEYKGYEHEGVVTYFKPPQANYRIVEYLKGPPLNKSLPVRFEFHEKVGQPKPANWKFNDSMMPAKGSKWIIFIPNAVPIDGMFETYHGSYGRLEYTEDNLDKILKIIEAHKGQTR
ncbi:MAG: tetratricopeptide repeat protein, partial [Cyanobacteria bacterium]|nr:tetratricopeptide repeat protein [Cyanobacteriota bacterium]